MAETPSHSPSAAYVALKGRCPACGKGKLYKSFLNVADRCNACGLDFSQHEQGDGPAYLAILFVGAFSAIGATVMDIKLAPPLWVHAALWIPVVVLGSLICLRWMKAALIAVQYQYRKDHFRP